MELYAKKGFRKEDKTYKYTKNTILTVIICVTLVMILATLFCFIATPEFLVKNKIESLVADYYENYYYDLIPDPNVLTEYEDHGFARLDLHELLLFDNERHGAATEYLSEYCSLEKTMIKIYPIKPFGRKDYRVEYSYSCNF